MRQPLHIAMLESGGWGGIGHYSYNLCQALAQSGCRVTLISGTPYELQHLPRDFQLEALIPADIPYLQKLGRAARCLRSLRPDLLHIQSTFAARRDWLALTFLKAVRYPVVFTAHNILPHDAGERDTPGMRLAYDILYTLSDRIVVHSENIRRELLATFRPPSERVVVIPHGDYIFTETGVSVDPAGAKRWLGISSDHRLLLAFGAIRAYKGIPDLIEAFGRVNRTFPDTYLAIVGKPLGVDPEDYRSHIRRLNLDRRVILRPEYVPFEDIGRYFQATDIAVFPYRAIAQSGALQLAYAFAKPVVVTRVGAFPETVQEGQNGLIVPPADPSALADALIHLLDLKPALLAHMGRRSRKLAEKKYSWGQIAHKTLSLYNQVLLENAK